MSAASQSVTVVISSTIQSGKMETAKEALHKVISTVLETEKACQQIEVFDDPDNPQQLLIIEAWDSKEVFLGPHMETAHMQAFMKLAASFIQGQPEFTFWNKVISAAKATPNNDKR